MRSEASDHGSIRFSGLSTTSMADIAIGLARSAECWMDHLTGQDDGRSSVRLVATDDFDAWLISWPRDTRVSPHDHGLSDGVFTVVSGELTEVRWGETTGGERPVKPGETVAIGAGTVHDVVSGSGEALSVHVYSPPLTSMFFCDRTGDQAEGYWAASEGEPVVGAARGLHPSQR